MASVDSSPQLGKVEDLGLARSVCRTYIKVIVYKVYIYMYLESQSTSENGYKYMFLCGHVPFSKVLWRVQEYVFFGEGGGLSYTKCRADGHPSRFMKILLYII